VITADPNEYQEWQEEHQGQQGDARGSCHRI
jgi:hypothetical protein